MTTYPYSINGLSGDLASGDVVDLGGGASLRRVRHVAWIEYGDLNVIGEGFPPSAHFDGYIDGVAEFDIGLPMGTRHVMYIAEPELRIKDKDQPFIDWYLKYGWAPGHFMLGPYPDPEATESTGSGRLHAMRCLALSNVMGYVMGQDYDLLPQQSTEFMRWVKAQAERGCSYRYSEELYHSWYHPQHYFGTGYNSQPHDDGGFSTHYSSILPPGVAAPSGKYIGHATHGTIEGLAGVAILTKDDCAGEIAVLMVESWASSLMSGETWSSRAFGRFFRGLAMLCPMTPYWPWLKERILRYAFLALKALKSRHFRGMIAPDNGKTSEGGHMTFDDVQEVYGHLGLSDDEIKNEAKSDVSWMVTQCADGLMDLYELAQAYSMLNVNDGSGSLGIRIKDEVKLCALYLRDQATAPMWSVNGIIDNLPGSQIPHFAPMGVWDNNNGHGLGQGGIFSSGVGQRFLLRTFPRLDGFLGLEGDERFEPKGEQMLAWSEGHDVWGGAETSKEEWELGQ